MNESERPVPEAPTPDIYKKGLEEQRRSKIPFIGRRSVPDILLPGQMAYDEWLPRLPWLNRFFKPQKGTPEHGEKRAMTRRQFFETIINGTAVAAYAFGVYKAYEFFGKDVVERFINPNVSKEGEAINSQEVVLFYFLNGASQDPKKDGVSTFARDIAIASLGVNVVNQKPVNFLDRSTWGHSELTVYMGAMDRFFTDIVTDAGRNNLRSSIDRYAGSRSEEYKKQIAKYEAYVQKNPLEQWENPMDQLGGFFTADPTEKGGLGYSQDQWNLITETLNAYRSSSMTPELKEKLNKVNEKSGTSFRIP